MILSTVTVRHSIRADVRLMAAACLGATRNQREVAHAAYCFLLEDLSTASGNPTTGMTSAQARLSELQRFEFV